MQDFHPIIEYLLSQSVPLETIVTLLLFPLIATLVVILRQVVGLQAFGIYTPSIITFAFLAIGGKDVSDIKYAIAIFVIVLVVGMAMRYILTKLRLLYLPRVAITLTVVSLTVLFALAMAGYFSRTGFAAAAIFPILIIITLVEKFVAVQVEKDTKTAIILAIETLIIALVGYLLMSPETPIGYTLITFILAHPYIILFVIPLHIFLGKWTGLRVVEYLRFRNVLKKIQ